jgi:hypothetical protein
MRYRAKVLDGAMTVSDVQVDAVSEAEANPVGLW